MTQEVTPKCIALELGRRSSVTRDYIKLSEQATGERDRSSKPTKPPRHQHVANEPSLFHTNLSILNKIRPTSTNFSPTIRSSSSPQNQTISSNSPRLIRLLPQPVYFQGIIDHPQPHSSSLTFNSIHVQSPSHFSFTIEISKPLHVQTVPSYTPPISRTWKRWELSALLLHGQQTFPFLAECRT